MVIHLFSILAAVVLLASLKFKFIGIAMGAAIFLCLFLTFYIIKSLSLRKEFITYRDRELIKIPESVKLNSPSRKLLETKPENVNDAYSVINSLTMELGDLYAKKAEEAEAYAAELSKKNELLMEKTREAEQLLEKHIQEININNTLYEFAEIVSGTRSIPKLYAELTDKLKSEFQCESVFILTIDNEDEEFKLKIKKGSVTNATIRNIELSGLLDGMKTSYQSVRLGQADGDKLLQLLKGDSNLIRNILCVPLGTKSDSKPIGVIGLINSTSEDDFSEENEDSLKLIATEAAISLKNITYAHQIEISYEETMLCLAQALEGRDKYTQGHVDRVRELSVQLASSLQLPEEEIKMIRRAATLHDVGKITTPDNILHKTTDLTEEEWSVMRNHADMSAKILEPISNLPREVIDMVRCHHERWDGSGYPQGLSKDMIPRGAQIIAIADAFDALTSDRPYRKGLSFEEALRKLNKESIGTQFDPEIITEFLVMMSNKLKNNTVKRKR